MAYTQADLDVLDAAIKSGVVEVRYQDRTVRYRSMEELRSARALAYAEVNGRTMKRQARMSTSKGL